VAWIHSQANSDNNLGTPTPVKACSGGGDYDVWSNGFLRAYFESALNTSIDPADRQFLVDLVAGKHIKCSLRESPTGPFRDGDEYVGGGIGKETENHLLFIESNRFLWNQQFSPSDNTAVQNGFTEQQWLQDRLKAIFEGYFYEYNSETYESYHAASIGNLFENTTTDPTIKTASRMILDLVSAHQALATKDLRRMAPFRRHPVDWNPNVMVGNYEDQDRLEILTGDSRMLANECTSYPQNQVATAAGAYRIPDPILDRLLVRPHQRGFGRVHLGNRGSIVTMPNTNDIRVDGWETFYQDPDFLISGGGISTLNQYTHDCIVYNCAPENENGRDVFTTVMPTGTVKSTGLTLHIEQPLELEWDTTYWLRRGKVPNWRKTCVGPNFACGNHVVIPPEMSDVCQKTVGKFTFVDFTGTCAARAGLPVDKRDASHGFFAAVFKGDGDWGFFEVEGFQTVGAKVSTLDDFAREVTTRNPVQDFSAGRSNTYTTLQGDTIHFAPIDPVRFDQWNLTGITRNCAAAINPGACAAQAVPTFDGGAAQSRPLAEGDFITNTDPATGETSAHRVFVPNPFTCQQVIMDYSDSTNPFYVDPQNQKNRLCALTGGSCTAQCTRVSPTQCSCPTTPACMPPSDVAGPMPVDSCQGFFTKFQVGAACPRNVGMWSATPGSGTAASVVLASGGPAAVVGPGDLRAAPAVGFQMDFPWLPPTVPIGCTAQTQNGVTTQVTCAPVNGNHVLDLVPGRYADVTVQATGTLLLAPGDYLFDSLQIAAAAHLQLPAGQRVRVVVKNAASLSADVKCFDASGFVSACDPDGAASSFGLMDLGTSDVVVGTSLAGTIVAPSASIVVGPGAGTTVHGAFWSNRSVSVTPSSTIVVPSTNVFFDPSDAPAYPACGAQ
jgi:hypothetical protein